MRLQPPEYGVSYDTLLRECEEEGDSYFAAHDERIYVQLLTTIIYMSGVISVVEIEEEEVEGVEASMSKLAIPESD